MIKMPDLILLLEQLQKLENKLANFDATISLFETRIESLEAKLEHLLMGEPQEIEEP